MGKFRTERSTMVRIWRIYNLIKNSNYPDARQLADQLEVSLRTIERDIEQLRDQMQAPIVYDRMRRGYYFSKEYNLPPIRFTEGEILSIIIGQKLLSQMEGSAVGPIFRNLREKLECLLGEESPCSNRELEEAVSFGIAPLRGEDWRVAQNLAELREAVFQRQQVEIIYNSISAGEKRKRQVRPYHLRFFDGAWYLIGYCLLRQEVRIFAVDRIETLRKTGAVFEYPADFKIEEYLDGVWGIMRGRPYHVKIWFDSHQARWIRERPLRDGERLEESADGTVILETAVSGLMEIKRWIMGFGSHAKVLEPAELREEIREELIRMGEIYGVKEREAPLLKDGN